MNVLSGLDDDARYDNVHTGLASVCLVFSGDVTLGSGDSYFGGNLTAYIKNGTIPESRVDDMGMFPIVLSLPSSVNVNASFRSYPHPGWLVLSPPRLALLPPSQFQRILSLGRGNERTR